MGRHPEDPPGAGATEAWDTEVNRSGRVVLMAGCITVSSWLFGPAHAPSMPSGSPLSHAVATAEAQQGERTLETVERLSALYRGIPARPGVRPAFIPSGVLVVGSGGEVRRVDLGRALTGRAGSIVAWLP